MIVKYCGYTVERVLEMPYVRFAQLAEYVGKILEMERDFFIQLLGAKKKGR